MPRQKQIDLIETNLEELDSSIKTSITGETETEYYPITPLVSLEPIQFDIPETYTQLTDPNFLLKLTAKVTEADGAQLKQDARVAPVNLTLHALFRDVTLKANGVVISQATNTYPYRAYIETNFTYSTAAKTGAVGIPQMYQKEKSGKFEATVVTENPSFDYRVAKFAKSALVEMAGRLHCDFLLQNKLILPGVRFSITLMPTPTTFHLLSSTAIPLEKLVITKIVLKVRRLNLMSSAILNIERSLQSKPIVYPINRATVRTTQLTAGQTQLSNFVLHNGQIPRVIIITAVQSSSNLGSYRKNPFNFTLKKCSMAQIEVNGHLYPPIAYNPNESWIYPYLNSLRVVRKLFTDTDTGITLDDFLENGHQILSFDLNPEEGGIPTRSNGIITFTGQWPVAAIDDNYTLLYYLLWDNNINIDHRRNVLLDFIP